MKKVLVTGANGFIGMNLIVKLKEICDLEIFTYDKNNNDNELEEYIKQSDFIFHLAGVNRPTDEVEFITGNVDLTQKILDLMGKYNKKSPVLITSSIQAEYDNPYGRSKKEAEERLISFANKNGSKLFIYRLPNVFGKWCRPNYNSAIATFCYNICHDLDIWVSDENKILSLVYIDDVVDTFIKSMFETIDITTVYYSINKVYEIALGEIVSRLKQFRQIRNTAIIPDLSDDFTKYLYSTYLSYLNDDNFSYKLVKKEDNRGWLSELVKSNQLGQMFVSKTHEGITRGNHYHHTKVEKFIVIQGKASVRLRKIDKNEVLEYIVEGEQPEVVDIPPGYTHSIENIGKGELITLFWANEIFNEKKPDTYFNEVIK